MLRDSETGRTLIVVGAALGSGRWLANNVLSAHDWDDIYLVDSDRSRTSLSDLKWSFRQQPSFARSVETIDGIAFAPELENVPCDQLSEIISRSREIVVCMAVPPSALAAVAHAIRRLVPRVETVLVSATEMVGAFETLERAGFSEDVIVGLHALNDPATESALGQTIVLATDSNSRLSGVIEYVTRAGAVARVMSPMEHDHTMAVVQALTHRVLFAFADAVTTSDIALEELWVARTPLFEALLSLSARALDTRQQATIATAQEGLSSPSDLYRFVNSLARIRAQSPTADEVSRWMSEVRNRFTGSLFDSLKSTAASSISSTQQRQIELAESLSSGHLVGLRRRNQDRRVHVGRIVQLSPTEVLIEELVMGHEGSAVLLEGEGVSNARRLGVPTRTTVTTLSLGNITVLSGAELEAYLDNHLGHITRDVRFLVPESVSGSGVLKAISELQLVRDALLVDEVVRTGQRSVVVRFGIRADRSIEATIEAVQQHVALSYQWPAGVTRPITHQGAQEVVYLGPAGTFSENAAQQLAHRIESQLVHLTDVPGFDQVLSAVADGALGVIPISSSASGLVTRAVNALVESDSSVIAGGVIDVAVRFDAYTQRGGALDELKGSTVYSHPQALAQCRAFVRRLALRPVEVESTAAALERVAQSPVRAIALAGANKEAESGLRVLEREVDDLSGSITRFLVLGRKGAFGSIDKGSAPTLRSVVVGRD